MTDTIKQEDFSFTQPYPAAYTDIMIPATFVKGKPKIVGPGPNAKYGATFVVDPAPKVVNVDGKDVDMSDMARLKREVIAMLKAHNKTGKQLKIGLLTEEQEAANSHVSVNVPWRDGTKEADKAKAKGKDNEVFRGKLLVKGTSKYPPVLSAIENGKLLKFPADGDVQPVAANKFFYSGALLIPSFGLHWYKGDEGKPDGVSLYLNEVLFAKHGPRLGGRTRDAAETFKGYIGQITNEDPTGGAGFERDDLDDEIPF